MIFNELEMTKTDLKLPISESLYVQLLEDILTGKISSGAKLTEQELCNLYGVSRTPVREALHQLEIEGLIEIIPNRGAFAVGFSERDISDIYMLRREYEVLAAGWAIERISDEQYEKLEEIFEFMEFYTAKGDFEKMRSINVLFHRTIYGATGSRLLINILTSYQIYIEYYLRGIERKASLIMSKGERQELLVDLLEEHRNIMEAFRQKEKLKGEEAMRFHINQSIHRNKVRKERLCNGY